MAMLLLALILALATPASAHEWYAGLRAPDGRGCCNEADCAPAEVRFNVELGQLEVLSRGQWWLADDQAYFLGPSPDGSWHVCRTPDDPAPRCTMGGAGT